MQNVRFYHFFTITLVLLLVNQMNAANLNSQLPDDDNLYLEEVYGESALNWVREQNAVSTQRLEASPEFSDIKTRVRELVEAPDRLQTATFAEEWAYNFWQDKSNPRGLWRRTKIENYLRGNPQWDVLIDFDQLARKEGKNWIYQSANRFKNRALIALSDGGKDAAVIREFDMDKKEFVTDGFILPEAKNDVDWIDINTLFLGLATEQKEVTRSGYPVRVRIWKRGQQYANAPVVFKGRDSDVSVVGYSHHDVDTKQVIFKIVARGLDFFNYERFIDLGNGIYQKLDVPTDAEVSYYQNDIYITLKENWSYNNVQYKQGTLLKFNVSEFLAGRATAKVLFVPNATTFLANHFIYKERIFLLLSQDVNNKVVELVAKGDGYEQRLLALPENSTISFSSFSNEKGVLTISVENFIQPTTIYSLDLASNTLKSFMRAPARFDANLYQVEQYFVSSNDGTRVPYYVVHKKGLVYNGANPTIINAYGGFEVSKTPVYSAAIEAAWLSRGGVWVLANIRGGGEYGPAWHKAGLKENRQRVYDDFFAVTEDVIARKIASPRHLGAVGGSNGGLLMGVALTQRPDLYNAIAVQVPLLDMLRYHKLLAGNSWIGEYGNPDIAEEREYIRKYSPYQNLRYGTQYPEPFFMTSTADDRVHPGHARRMAKRMQELGLKFMYYENTEGGHGGSANNEQRAYWSALQFQYFLNKLR